MVNLGKIYSRNLYTVFKNVCRQIFFKIKYFLKTPGLKIVVCVFTEK